MYCFLQFISSAFFKMAVRYTADEVQRFLDEDDDFSLLEEDDSDFEGEGICGYLPEVDSATFPGAERDDREDDEEGAVLASPGLQQGTVGQFSGRHTLLEASYQV